MSTRGTCSPLIRRDLPKENRKPSGQWRGNKKGKISSGRGTVLFEGGSEKGVRKKVVAVHHNRASRGRRSIRGETSKEENIEN